MSRSKSGEWPLDHSVFAPERSDVVTPSVQVRVIRPSDNEACVPSVVATALPLLTVVAADAAAGASARHRQAATSPLMPRKRSGSAEAFRIPSAFRTNPQQMTRGWRLSPLVAAMAICLALAIASLALPSGPTYDPYAWLIWGRDPVHLDLVTTGGGTSWKPLPAFIDALLTPLGGGAAAGWLVVARAGAMFAVFMAGRLAWRLAPSQRLLAGVTAGVCVVLTREWLVRNRVGDAEGLMAAFGLLPVDRPPGGHRGQAFALIVAASLIRVEAWPFAIGYAAWLCWHGERRRSSAFGLALLPLLWFGGDWVGSGSLSAASDRALHRVPGSPGASAHPALAVLTEAVGMLPPAAWIAVAVAAAVAIHRRERITLALLGLAAAWTAVVAAMAQRGYAGLPRFLFMATALEAVAV